MSSEPNEIQKHVSRYFRTPPRKPRDAPKPKAEPLKPFAHAVKEVLNPETDEGRKQRECQEEWMRKNPHQSIPYWVVTDCQASKPEPKPAPPSQSGETKKPKYFSTIVKEAAFKTVDPEPATPIKQLMKNGKVVSEFDDPEIKNLLDEEPVPVVDYNLDKPRHCGERQYAAHVKAKFSKPELIRQIRELMSWLKTIDRETTTLREVL